MTMVILTATGHLAWLMQLKNLKHTNPKDKRGVLILFEVL